MEIITCYLSLGTNLGDRHQNLLAALSAIEEQIGHIVAKSSIYESEPWGVKDQPAFYNMVVEVNTALDQLALLNKTLSIETSFGRQRRPDLKWKERELDIDILYFGENAYDSEVLKVPHPFLHQRRFVLLPLMEIASQLQHPLFRKSTKQLLEECQDTLNATKLELKT